MKSQLIQRDYKRKKENKEEKFKEENTEKIFWYLNCSWTEGVKNLKGVFVKNEKRIQIIGV